MATATKTRAGFRVCCPHCGAVEGLVIQVHDLTVTCRECDEETTRDDLERLRDDCDRLLCWLTLAVAPFKAGPFPD